MAFETPEERLQARMLLQMAVLAATVGGRPFDDELQQLVDRALEGDESIDLDSLLKRVNDHLPKSSSTDPATWTFDEGLRASCEYFSIAIPDGFRVLTDYDDGFLTRPFVAVPSEVEDKDIPTADRLACGATPMPEPENFAEHGIDELAVMTFRSTANKGDFSSPKVPLDWVVRGKNCDVLIMLVDNGCTGYEYWIRPAIPQMGYYVRCIFSNSDADRADEAREALTTMAKSVEATQPIESELTRQLKRITTSKVGPEEFCEAAEHLLSILAICRDRCHEANQRQYVANIEDESEYGFTRAIVLGMEAYVERTFPLYASLVDALDFQKAQGTGKNALAQEAEAVEPITDQLLLKFNTNDRGGADFLAEHGPIALPGGYWSLIERLDAYLPGTRQAAQRKIKNRDRELQENIERFKLEGSTTRNDPSADTYDEPGGVDYPALIMTLLSDDWFFFKDDEITWDGHHHAIAGAQFNGAKVDGFLGFVNSCIPGFDDANEVFRYFVTLLNEIEKDEGLIVPRAMIAPGVQQAIREGDLTGLTLANLAACGRAFSVEKVKPGVYRVIFDGRLISGIPRFLDLVARLVWDLRQCTNSMRGKPFEIGFLQARNIDADQYLGSVDTPVPGAQEYAMFMKVTEAPAIQLLSANDAKAHHEQDAKRKQPTAAPKQAATHKKAAATKQAAASASGAAESELEPKIPAPTTTFKPKPKPKPLHLKDVAGIKSADVDDLRRGFPAEEDGGSDRTLDLMRQMTQTVKRSRGKEVTECLKGPNGGSKGIERATTLAVRYNYALCELATSELMAVERHLRCCTPDDVIAEMIACVRSTLQLVARDLAVPKARKMTLTGIYVPSAVASAHGRMIACEKRLADESEKRAALRKENEKAKNEEREIVDARDAFNDAWKLFEAGKRAFELSWNQAKTASAKLRASGAGCELDTVLPGKSSVEALRRAISPQDFAELDQHHTNLESALKGYISALVTMRANAHRLLEASGKRASKDLRRLDIDLQMVKTCSRYIDAKTAQDVATGYKKPELDPRLTTRMLEWLELKRDQSLTLGFGTELQRCQAKLDELKAERRGLGFFAFEKKKALADEIKTVKKQAANLSEAAAAEASLHSEDLDALERTAICALKDRFGDTADDLTSLYDFLMRPDLR